MKYTYVVQEWIKNADNQNPNEPSINYKKKRQDEK